MTKSIGYTEAMEQATELLDVAQNSDRAPTSLTLDTEHLQEIDSDQYLNFAGQALKTTTSVSSIEIRLQDAAAESPAIKDICSILSTNPNLKFVDVKSVVNSDTGHLQKAASFLVSAASRNTSIEKIYIYSGRRNEEAADLSGFQANQISISKHIKEVEINGKFNYDDANWPENHTLQTLSLKNMGENSESESDHLIGGRLPNLWKTFTQKSISVHQLVMDEWSPSLPLYMVSPKSNIQRLDFIDVDFAGAQMDGLIYGLVGSQSVVTLNFRSCDIDRMGLQKLGRAVKAGLTAIKHFSYFNVFHTVYAADLKTFLDCDCLETLKLLIDKDSIDNQNQYIDSVKAGLLTSSLTTFGVWTQQLEQLAPSLKIALSSRTLTGLTLRGCAFNESSLRSLMGLIQDEECQLLSLELCDWYGGAEKVLVPRLLGAIACRGKLKTLVLKSHRGSVRKGLITGLQNNLHKVQTLEVLHIFTTENTKFTLKQESSLALAFAGNWSLDDVLCVEKYADDYGDPSLIKTNTTAAFKRKVESLCQRNKEKKSIFEMESDDICLEKKKELIRQLESYWALPDSLSLSFWLLQRLAGVFF